MTQEQLGEALKGKTISKINFGDAIANNFNIKSIEFTSGELLTITEQTELTHHEADEEVKAFFEVLKNIPPSGIISFKAVYLPQGLIERELAAKHKELKSLGYGQRSSIRQDYLTYRFDMPE